MSNQREDPATFYLAVSGAFAILAVSALAVRLLRSAITLRAAMWLSLMLILAAVAVHAARTRRAAIVWLAAGGVCGFAVFGAASIGLLFAPGGLILLGAGFTTVPTTDARTNLWNAVWLLWGGSGTSAVAVLIAWWNRYRFVAPEYHVTAAEVPPPIVVLGVEVFLATSALLFIRLLLRGRDSAHTRRDDSALLGRRQIFTSMRYCRSRWRG
jgi:hypothetical protein